MVWDKHTWRLSYSLITRLTTTVIFRGLFWVPSPSENRWVASWKRVLSIVATNSEALSWRRCVYPLLLPSSANGWRPLFVSFGVSSVSPPSWPIVGIWVVLAHSKVLGKKTVYCTKNCLCGSTGQFIGHHVWMKLKSLLKKSQSVVFSAKLYENICKCYSHFFKLTVQHNVHCFIKSMKY